MPRRPLQNMLLLVSLMAVEAVADQWIESGLYTTTPHWNDTDGNRIEAHATGLLESPADGGRWYWYGESKKGCDLADHGVNCYSAAALGGPWRSEGQVKLAPGECVISTLHEPLPGPAAEAELPR